VTAHSLHLSLPTPVQRLQLGGLRAELWLKQDGLTHPLYGGNKARKAALLLEHAARIGARRVLTFGAAGSHHVLAMTLFAREFGLEVAAVLLPQPATAHAQAVLARSVAAGLHAFPSGSLLRGLLGSARAHRRGDYVILPGGSNARGAEAHARAIAELEGQVDAGLLPAPDWIVVPLGSGGTAAGLLAGLARSRLRARLLAVSVVENPLAAAQVRFLASRCLRLQGSTASDRAWRQRLTVDGAQLGRGYGWATPAGERATQAAASVGLTLDPTYTAKAFASALQLARGEQLSITPPARVLYWHTLSVADGGVVTDERLPPQLQRLLITT
jgi:1-aminocyclopropane-1-carboxylate deaminase/D-cysteine desulfhydrase-like pyridoxal-dependent ACC family enzyme